MVNRMEFAAEMVRTTSTSFRLGWITLPFIGRVEAYALDGKACLLPPSGGVVAVDWFRFCRFLRRRKLRWGFQ